MLRKQVSNYIEYRGVGCATTPRETGRGVGEMYNLQDDEFHGVAERHIQQGTDCVT